MGSYYLRAWHMRWFNDHIGDGVTVRDLGEDTGASLCQGQLENGDPKADIQRCRGTSLHGLWRVRHWTSAGVVGRLSVTGEVGYEIHCRMGDHATLRKALLDAGADEGIIEYV